MSRFVILKTDTQNIQAVLRSSSHATDDPPRDLEPGDLILIHQEGARTTPPRITHVMICDQVYEDVGNESDRLWGRHWRFIVKGKSLQALKRPLPISAVAAATNKNYGQGPQRYVYLEPDDCIALLKSDALAV
jgi:5-methylcytosine-specific restriction enzyme A